MHTQYYVQEIAGNYLKNISDGRDASATVAPAALQGLEAFRLLLKRLLTDIIDDPSAFGMLLKENIEPDAKNVDYTNSNASFVRVPNLLFVLGITGVLGSDYALICEGGALAAACKEMKITNPVFLLGKLAGYGFTIEGLNKTLKPGDQITLNYSDCPALTEALKLIADAQLALNKGKMRDPKNYFYMAHSGLLALEKSKAPKLTIDDILHTLAPDRQTAAAELHNLLSNETKQAVRMGGFMRNDWSCVYTSRKTNKVLMTLHVNQDKLSFKLNLQNIGSYINKLSHFPSVVMDVIRASGWDCGHCNGTCAGGFAFELDGQAYNKCRCGSFMFDGVTPETIPYCKELLLLELAA